MPSRSSRALGWQTIAMALLSGCGAETRDTASGDEGGTHTVSDAGWAALVDWDALPVLGNSLASQSSSRDRVEVPEVTGIEAGNKDFNNFLAVCGDRPQVFLGTSDGGQCEPGLDGYVIASADDGPGFVSRIFLAAGTLNGGVDLAHLTTGFIDETIRVYVDDLSKPAYEGTIADLENGSKPPFVPPLTSSKSGALVSYVPISYRSKLRVVLDDLRTQDTTYYYQVDRRSAGETSGFSPEALAAALPDGVAGLQTSAEGVEGTSRWADADSTLAPGETTVILDRAGPGTLRRFRVTLDLSALDNLDLQVTWDDQPQPVIDVSLAALFACDPAPAAFDTLPMSVQNDGSHAVLTLTLPMPFASHALFSLKNTAAGPYVVHSRMDGVSRIPAADWGYLHATPHERALPGPGEHYEVVGVAGRGKYVGTVMRLTGHADPNMLISDPFNFLEGDDLSVADGESATQGTGTEEYFDGGWYFRSGPFAAPFSAAVTVGPGSTDGSGLVAAVRWQLLGDAIDFQRSFDLTFEYGPNVPEIALDYSSVALYYAN